MGLHLYFFFALANWWPYVPVLVLPFFGGGGGSFSANFSAMVGGLVVMIDKKLKLFEYNNMKTLVFYKRASKVYLYVRTERKGPTCFRWYIANICNNILHCWKW